MTSGPERVRIAEIHEDEKTRILSKMDLCRPASEVKNQGDSAPAMSPAGRCLLPRPTGQAGAV